MGAEVLMDDKPDGLEEIPTTQGLARGIVMRSHDGRGYVGLYAIGPVTFTGQGETRSEVLAVIRAKIAMQSIVGQGLQVFWGGNCPVQAEGRVDGLPCYFRARGESWQFCVAATPTGDPLDAYDHKGGTFYIEGQADETGKESEFRAGYMEDAEVKRHLSEAIDLFREWNRQRGEG